MTTNIKDYSTTQASNTTLNTINVAEGMLPSNLNNAIRALMKNTRDWFNESQWIEYGDGSGTPVITYVSATSFKVTGDNSTAHYVANRRVKVTGSATGTIYGTISSSAFDSVDATTVVVVWDSGQLSSEVLRVYSGILTPTNTSIPSGIIVTANIADGSVTTPKLADDAVTNAKVATNAIAAPELATNAVTEAKISDSQVTTVKLADNAVTTVKITDDNVTTAKIADNAVTTAKITNSNVTADKLASNSVTTAKILNANVTTDKIADDNVTTAKILNSNVTTAKIADDAITAAKIADAVLITASEQSTSTPDDVTVFTTSAANNRFFNVDSSETINSGQVWSDSDSYIATTAAITNRIIDLVDDVGGFVPIASYTKFPNTNPDPNDGTGTVVSITDMTSFTYNTGTGVSTNSTTVGGTAVTITGIPATIGSPITVAYGLLVETTTTLNTYTFVRLVPIATEVNTVASISGNITTVANNTSNINSVAGNATNINKVATIDSNVTTVAGIAANVTTVAGDTANIATVAGNATNINLVGNNITNVNNVGGSITNVNTVATNIVDVNSFADTYFISGTAPSSPTTGDLWFDTSASTMKVYSGSGWQNAGSSVNGTSARFQYTVSGTPTTVSGTDDNGNTLAYDAGYVDVYLNGLKMLNGTDVTVTSGTSVVFASALQGSDIVDIIAYGTFNVAAINAGNITSGTLNNARLSSDVTLNTGTQTLTNKTINGSNNTISNVPNSALVGNGAITINGSAVSLGSSTTIETGISWQTSIVTATTLTAVAGKGYWINTTSNVCTITLPASASVGDQLIFVDYARTWATNAVTINQNGLKYQGGTLNPVYDTNGQTVNIVYSGATKGWIPISDDDVTDESVALPYSTDFLVIAGGGAGGGGYRAGGGGAGGYRNSFSSEASGGGGSSESSLTLTPGVSYTVTIGAGGTGAQNTQGNVGNNSLISGSDITTITSIGGGGGGKYEGSGSAGGSGGGAGSPSPSNVGSGTSNQGFAGGASIGDPTQCGGGGGGASQVGFNAGTGATSGDGGAGLASAITGSSLTRAGGGGGGNYGNGNVTVGGAGGGGAGGSGSSPYQNGVNGTANTGGGAGGSSGAEVSVGVGGTGGSGVVILSMPDASYSGTTTGSPTVATGVSGKTVLTFTGSGSYTG